MSAKILKNATLKVYPGFPHGMATTNPDQINADLLAFVPLIMTLSARCSNARTKFSVKRLLRGGFQSGAVQVRGRPLR